MTDNRKWTIPSKRPLYRGEAWVWDLAVLAAIGTCVGIAFGTAKKWDPRLDRLESNLYSACLSVARAVAHNDLIAIAAASGKVVEAQDVLANFVPFWSCYNCHGRGRVREWVAQDESRLVSCDSCKGTGSRRTT